MIPKNFFLMAICAASVMLSLVSGCGGNPKNNRFGDASPEDRARLVVKNRALSLAFDAVPINTPESSLTGGAPVDLRYLAEVTAPLSPDGGESLQAADFSWTDDGLVYVVYTRAGERIGGALDVIDLSTPSKPQLLHSEQFRDLEFAAVTRIDSYLYVAGRNEEGAVVVTFDIETPTLPRWTSTIPLRGNYATAIEPFGKGLHGVTGDSGVYFFLNRSIPFAPSVDQEIPIESARAIGHWQDLPIALSAPSKTILEKLNQNSFEHWITIDGSPQDAPSRFSVFADFILSNAGFSGLNLFSIRGDASIEHRHAASIPLPGTGNGLSVQNQMAWLAQGDAGVHWLDLKAAISNPPDYRTYSFPPPLTAPSAAAPVPVLRGNIDFEDDPGSANQTRSAVLDDRPILMIADGRSGVRLVEVIERRTFRASKTYGPTVFHDDVLYLTRPQNYTIPATIPVTSGNAGNHWVVLSFDDVLCNYKGGSSLSSPPQNNPTQWSRGLQYKLHSCTDGSSAGATISASWRVRVHVNNGHSGFSPTTVQINL